MRRWIGLPLAAVIAAACGGGMAVAPLAEDVADDRVLSSCSPAEGAEPVTLVRGDGARPSVEEMEASFADDPDAEFVIDGMVEEGHSRRDAVHAMYGQVVGRQLFDEATSLPGYVTGSFARPLDGDPFELSFSGPVPEQFDPSRHDLGSFGLVVRTGASGLDEAGFRQATEALEEVGLRLVSGYGDEIEGTGMIEVLAATAEQVAQWEALLDDPDRWCLVLAPRSEPCDDEVVAEARSRATSGDLENERPDPPTAERAEEVRRTYLGLSLEEARAKGDREGRSIRVTTQDGVSLGADADLDPGRLSVHVCQGVVVDTVMDLEPGR